MFIGGEVMKKLFAILAVAVLLTGCGSSEETKTGTAQTEKDDNGDYATAEITLQGDNVVSISLDQTKNGESKKELGDDYNMKSSSEIGKEWYEQVEFLENYIVKNGLDKVELTDDGYAKNDDVLAGCTMNISTLMEAANSAKENAEAE